MHNVSFVILLVMKAVLLCNSFYIAIIQGPTWTSTLSFNTKIFIHLIHSTLTFVNA